MGNCLSVFHHRVPYQLHCRSITLILTGDEDAGRFLQDAGRERCDHRGEEDDTGRGRERKRPGEPDVHSICVRLRDHRHQQHQEPLPPETRRLQSLQGACDYNLIQESFHTRKFI